ncbi:CZB domain-containing protein [Thalassolituus marinus]|uniref:CZB domain-containing protein n=1 Tax=Thalassolituus marinus TaxID=671053 RepID=A0ABS7ZRB7_9GAMM|nr:CZB domain-containing protein [Thalassolituus marinus]MCA6064271.1 CZB domain-containing protein [Thalassolituus marinus]
MPDIADRETVLLQIRKAKTAHLRWRAYAMALSSGYAVEEGQLPLQPTECQFGCWYYGAGQELKNLPAFKAIEAPHQRLHKIYSDIFQQLFDQPEPPFWKKLLGSTTTLTTAQDVEARIDELTACSREMLENLEALEKQIASEML